MLPDGRWRAPLLLLTATAAAADAISYLGLGRVFPANMTGNTVLLGIGLATGDLQSAGRSAVARLDVGVTTTYITGTWTAVSGWVAGRLVNRGPRQDRRHLLQLSVLACYFAVACAAAYAFHEWGPATAG